MDPHQNNNNNADLQPSFDAFLGVLSRDDGWEKQSSDAEDNRPANSGCLASKTYTPLEVALMMRANLEQVQIIYERFPAALTAQTIRNACRHGAQSGVVGFLAQKLGKEGLSERSLLDNKLPIHLAMQSGPGLLRPTEDDIQAMVDVYPECITEPALMMRGNTKMRPWQLGLQWQYSPSLLKFLFERLGRALSAGGNNTAQAKLLSLKPGSRHHDNCRQVMDSGCVQAMSLAFDQIESFSSAGYFGQSVSWRADAIVECFQRLLQNQNVSGVHFKISAPPQQDNDGTVEGNNTLTSDGQLQSAVVKKLAHLAPQCGIRYLVMPFEDAQTNPFYPALLGDPVLRMPHLQDLRTHVGHNVGPAVPLLRSLLLSSKTLHTLVLKTSKDPAGDLMPLLEVVRTNPILRTFRYREDEGPLSPEGSRYQAYLAESLTLSNTSLTSVCVSAGGSRRRIADDDESLVSQTIAFYTLLNGHGRRIARDRDTRLKELLPLLNAAGSSDYHDRNVNYGLLRECPWLWSGSCQR